MEHGLCALASLGIIGGADSPTAIFVTGSFEPKWLLAAGIALAAVAIAVLLRHRKK